MGTIIGAVIIIVLAGLGLSGKGRFLLKGFHGLLFKDIAKTPQGARAIYEQAIQETEKQYNAASDSLQRISGMLNTSQNNLRDAQEKLENTKGKVESLAKNQSLDQDKITVFGEALANYDEDVKLYTREVEEYTPMKQQAQDATETIERKLRKLKRDSKIAVKKLEMNLQTKEIYDSLDELKTSNVSDKMLNNVKEGAIDAQEMAVGAKSVYDSKFSTKLNKAEKDAIGSKYDSYLTGLVDKYKK